jgi:hypothetical protein
VGVLERSARAKSLSEPVSKKARNSFPATLLVATCAFVLFGILVFGLWPFRAPKNDVAWLRSGKGLVFGKHGSIVSSGSFEANPSGNIPCTIETWLEPDREDSSGTILVFYRPKSGTAPFVMRQSLGDLVLQHTVGAGSNKNAKIYVNDVFRRMTPVYLTIISNELGTAVYLDGVLVEKVSGFHFSGQDLTGRLVLGNSPDTTNEWSGQLRGLSVYNRELSANEVSQNFTDWTKTGLPRRSPAEGIVARYLFNEGTGIVVHNQIDSATDLLIPERFFVLHQQFLERPWKEFRPDWNYWQDVAINIGGFVPLGFFFRMYFFAVRRINRATLLTNILGFAVSLTIEVSQAFLPTRDSGMTDLITNTLGTALGAILSAWGMKGSWFRLFSSAAV